MDLNSPATLESISNSIIRPSVSRPLKNLYKGEPMALGITQIGIGILELAFGLVIVMAEDSNKYHYGTAHILTPYWPGILYIISGSLSVVVAKKPEIPLVKGMLGMNVVSAVAAGVAIVLLSISVAEIRYYARCGGYPNREMPPEICHEVVTIPYTVVIFQNTAQGTPPAVLTPDKEEEAL